MNKETYQDLRSIFEVKDQYPYETHDEYIQNIKRNFYVSISDIAMPEVGCELHMYHEAMKEPHHEIPVLDGPSVKAKDSYARYKYELQDLTTLINEYFKIPQFKDVKFEHYVKDLLKHQNYEKIGDLFDNLPDAPEAHWAWRNDHKKNPTNSITSEQDLLINVDEKTGKLAHKLGYKIEHWTDDLGHRCTGVIDNKTHQEVPFDQLPDNMQKQLNRNLALANYLYERK